MKSKNILVIGGTKGIGGAIVSNLLEAGAHVFYSSRSDAPATKRKNSHPFVFDAAQETFPKELVPKSLSGLVYCPGTINLRPFQRLKTEDFLVDLQTNLIGAINTIKACLPALKKSPDPSSIVLFSTVAVQTGMPFHSSVASAKGAVEGLARSLAAEFAPRIRVNAIAPSLTDTPLATDLLSSEEKRQASENRHPLKRIGSPEDIAHCAVYLLGEQARWITGQVFHIDGGMGAVRTFK